MFENRKGRLKTGKDVRKQNKMLKYFLGCCKKILKTIKCPTKVLSNYSKHSTPKAMLRMPSKMLAIKNVS
jgi:hypothetical protein